MEYFLLILFWCSVFLVVYPYVIYPAIMVAIGKLMPVPRPEPGELPSVSVLVAAYNEAEWIGRKIESTLSQDYPKDRLEVIVVSDGSIDRTADIVTSFRGSRVNLLVQEERKGKSVALNVGVDLAKGEILVFSDANALFAPGSIRALAEHFSDPGVGLVSGQGLYRKVSDQSSHIVANGYVSLEALIKTGENALGFIAGADGAIYALRRNLYRTLAPYQVNDLLHPIEAAFAGYMSRFDRRAYTIEPSSEGAGQEFLRHVRIIAQGFSIFFKTLPSLLTHRRWKEMWVLCSHRFLRWISLLGFIVLFCVSVLGDSPLYTTALVTQGLFYILAMVGWFSEHVGWRHGIFSSPYFLCIVSAAGVLGYLRFLQGGAQATWSVRGVGMAK